MKILVIAPVPPPITGHSLAAQVLVDGLARTHRLTVVNLSVGSGSDGRISGQRIVEVLKVLAQVWRVKRGAEAIYLTISESLAGNVKDLLIYAICYRRLSALYIHLHGGSIKKLLFDRCELVRGANAWFIRRMGGAIITGRSHLPIFSEMLPAHRIHIVPNFAQDNLFVDEVAVTAKFTQTNPLRVLYLSAMTAGKGYHVLADAYLSLRDDLQRRISLEFAGQFDSTSERAKFADRIADVPGILYHGVVAGEQKRQLFAQAHVFCLPTSMNEGQPISILEAYASGCVVLTTGQGGIRDVFTSGVNGFEFQSGSVMSLVTILEAIATDTDTLRQMALRNRALAGTRFRTERFVARLQALLERSGRRHYNESSDDGSGTTTA